MHHVEAQIGCLIDALFNIAHIFCAWNLEQDPVIALFGKGHFRSSAGVDPFTQNFDRLRNGAVFDGFNIFAVSAIK
mgnify:CR=1 FL=1